MKWSSDTAFEIDYCFSLGVFITAAIPLGAFFFLKVAED